MMLSFREGVAAKEIDLVIGVNFISCSGLTVFVFVLYFDQYLIKMAVYIAMHRGRKNYSSF